MMKPRKIDPHDGCCYRENCSHDLEKCCFLQSRNKKCMIYEKCYQKKF